jgi:hypothetical protein
MTLTVPDRTLTTRFLQHPPANRNDHATRFERWNKFVRHHDTSHGVAPAQERLDTREGSGSEINGGLIVEDELILFEATAEVHRQIALLVDNLLHRRREDNGTILAGALSPIHRNVSVTQQFFRLGSHSLCDADAGGYR